MTLSSIMLGPIYNLYGVDAVIAPGDYTIRAIDETQGIEITDAHGMLTVKPAAIVRVSDLTDLGLSRGDLQTMELTINDITWTINNTMPKPTKRGESDGQLILFLTES